MQHKIVDWGQAKAQIEQWKSQGETIVFTNGCFDILHAGHVSYLQKAKEQGTKLILGLNSDASVRRLEKSPNRPLQSQYSRSMVMAALQCIDLVVLFEQDTPLELITYLMPQVLVKGADYTIENIAGAKEVIAAGGLVKTIEFLPGYSTSAIEQKILNGNK